MPVFLPLRQTDRPSISEAEVDRTDQEDGEEHADDNTDGGVGGLKCVALPEYTVAFPIVSNGFQQRTSMGYILGPPVLVFPVEVERLSRPLQFPVGIGSQVMAHSSSCRG